MRDWTGPAYRGGARRFEAAVLSNYVALQHEKKLGPANPASPDQVPLFLVSQCEEKNLNLTADCFLPAEGGRACESAGWKRRTGRRANGWRN